jgi:hypothetical protein
MTVTEATAEVFLTAFDALPEKEREAILARFAADKSLVCDLIDLAIAAERRKEPSRSLEEYLSNREDDA